MNTKARDKELSDSLNFFRHVGSRIETNNSKKNEEITKELVRNKKECADLLNHSYDDAFNIKE